eukprot:PhM_4_TR229/c0_g1_i1/m.100048
MLFRLRSSPVPRRAADNQIRTWVVPSTGDVPKARPYLSRTRSWRGRVQVRFDDAYADRKKVLSHAFIWSPLRVGTLGLFASAGTYIYLGHDSFMFQLFGYESESMIETRVNPPADANFGNTVGHARAAYSPIRHMEVVMDQQKDYLYTLARKIQDDNNAEERARLEKEGGKKKGGKTPMYSPARFSSWW